MQVVVITITVNFISLGWRIDLSVTNMIIVQTTKGIDAAKPENLHAQAKPTHIPKITAPREFFSAAGNVVKHKIHEAISGASQAAICTCAKSRGMRRIDAVENHAVVASKLFFTK
jgi:hypothetical protein